MARPDQFARRLKKLGRLVEVNGAKAVRETAVAVSQTVILATPVDTGRARSNWLVGLGAARDDQVEPVQATAAIARNSSSIAGFRDGRLHITNNLPYINRLNEGHSAQAPAGFVETAITIGSRGLENFKLLRE